MVFLSSGGTSRVSLCGEIIDKEPFLLLLPALVGLFLLCSFIITQRGNSKRKIDFISKPIRTQIYIKVLHKDKMEKVSINNI